MTSCALFALLQFVLGQGRVIKGWDQGFATMTKGEKANLICRSEYIVSRRVLLALLTWH